MWRKSCREDLLCIKLLTNLRKASEKNDLPDIVKCFATMVSLECYKILSNSEI